MAMVGIGFPLSSAPGLRAQESAGRLKNAYVEKLEGGARNEVVWRRAPGLRELFDVTEYAGCRGYIQIGATLLKVVGERVVAVTKSGTSYSYTDLGELPGSRPVTIARNNKSPTPDIVCVDPDNGAYTLTTSGAPVSFADADLPQPNSVTAIDGYFVFSIGDGRFFNTGLNDITVDPLDYATAEFRPDTLLRAVTFGNDLYLFGTGSLEIWRNVGNAVGSPFDRVTAKSIGIAGINAVAGWEDGFSGQMVFVGSDRIVYRLDGGQPQRVSTHDVEAALQRLSLDDLTDIKAFAFMNGGHACIALVSASWCWVHDLTTGHWHERFSYQSDTFRGSQSVYAFGAWTIGDSGNGKSYAVDAETFREGNQPLVYEVTSRQAASFPSGLQVLSAQFDFVVGVGAVTGTTDQVDPEVLISWSDDGGYRWSTPVSRSLGRQGASRTRVSLFGCGLTGPQGRQWRLRISAPVYVGLLGGQMEIETVNT